jgi:hypothetical protein
MYDWRKLTETPLVNVVVAAVSYVEVEVAVAVVVLVTVVGAMCRREEQKESAPLVAYKALTMILTAMHSRFDVA